MDVEVSAGTQTDLPRVIDLLNAAGLTTDGLMAVPTSLVVARVGGEVIGGAALEHYGAAGLLRSLVVSPDRRTSGAGSRLVAAAESEAGSLGMRGIYLLTETAQGFFDRRGYSLIGRDAAPDAVRSSIEWSEACSDAAIAMSKAI